MGLWLQRARGSDPRDQTHRATSDAAALRGLSFGYSFDGIGNRLTSSNDTRISGYTQQRSQPIHAAHRAELLRGDWRSGCGGHRLGDGRGAGLSGGAARQILFGHVPVNNASGAVWQKLSVTAVKNQPAIGGQEQPDLIQKSADASRYIAPATESFAYDADGNLTPGQPLDLSVGRGKSAGQHDHAADGDRRRSPGAEAGLCLRLEKPAHPQRSL